MWEGGGGRRVCCLLMTEEEDGLAHLLRDWRRCSGRSASRSTGRDRSASRDNCPVKFKTTREAPFRWRAERRRLYPLCRRKHKLGTGYISAFSVGSWTALLSVSRWASCLCLDGGGGVRRQAAKKVSGPVWSGLLLSVADHVMSLLSCSVLRWAGMQFEVSVYRYTGQPSAWMDGNHGRASRLALPWYLNEFADRWV